MKKLLFFILLLGGIPVSYAHSMPLKIIRLAIIDDFHYQPFITPNEYQNQYFQGVEIAVQQAESYGYHIQYKYFSYGHNALDILKIVPQVNSWHPDAIIGPRSSNTFLLLNGYFQNVLVLSPFASASNVKLMPDNFYSLVYPDEYMGAALFEYIDAVYPSKKVFGIIQGDCKSCMDVADSFANAYNRNHSNEIKYQYFTGGNPETLNVESLLVGYEVNQLILLPNYSYDSAVLMSKITNILKRPTIFLGDDDWGTWTESAVGKISAVAPYVGIRLTPISFDLETKEVTEFKNRFYKAYNIYPDNTAGYIGYNAVFSILSALKLSNLSDEAVLSMKSRILLSYLNALQINPNWFRSPYYAIYKVNLEGEKFMTKIKIPGSH